MAKSSGPVIPPSAQSETKAPDRPNPPIEVLEDGDMQALKEFYENLQASVTSAGEALSPFLGKHPLFPKALNKIFDSLELASMYMDRAAMYVKNPGRIPKMPEQGDDKPEAGE